LHDLISGVFKNPKQPLATALDDDLFRSTAALVDFFLEFYTTVLKACCVLLVSTSYPSVTKIVSTATGKCHGRTTSPQPSYCWLNDKILLTAIDCNQQQVVVDVVTCGGCRAIPIMSAWAINSFQFMSLFLRTLTDRHYTESGGMISYIRFRRRPTAWSKLVLPADAGTVINSATTLTTRISLRAVTDDVIFLCVRTDDKVYNCKTAAICVTFLLIR
jgi:hypothetical protein